MASQIKCFCLALGCALLLASGGWAGTALAQEAAPPKGVSPKTVQQEAAALPEAARAEKVSGKAMLLRGETVAPLKAGMAVQVADAVLTGPGGKASFTAVSGARVELGPEGALSFLHTGVPASGGKSVNSLVLALGKGLCRVESESGNAFIRTPQALFDLSGAGAAQLEAGAEQSAAQLLKAGTGATARFNNRPLAVGARAVVQGKAENRAANPGQQGGGK